MITNSIWVSMICSALVPWEGTKEILIKLSLHTYGSVVKKMLP